MSRIQYHNLVKIAGPADVVALIKKRLVISGGEPIDPRAYIPMPEAIENSDEMKMRRFWRSAHWGFVASACRVEYVDINESHADSLGYLNLHVITTDGHLDKVLREVSVAHPRAHITHEFVMARPAIQEFLGSGTTFAEGVPIQRRHIKAEMPQPLFIVWKMFAVLEDPYETVGLGEATFEEATRALKAATTGAVNRALTSIRELRAAARAHAQSPGWDL